MKIIKTVLIVFAVVIGIVLIVSVFLPSKYKVTRETTIAASMDVVFNQVNDFNQMQNWSPWRDYDPGMTISVEGEMGKAGYKYSWASKNKEVGSGSLTRITTAHGKMISNELSFADYDMKSLNVWTFEQMPEGVKVVWGNEGDIPFLGRIFFMMMDPDKMMGPDFEKGLARLKSYCEKNDKQVNA